MEGRAAIGVPSRKAEEAAAGRHKLRDAIALAKAVRDEVDLGAPVDLRETLMPQARAKPRHPDLAVPAPFA